MNLIERVKNIILTPKTEWPVIAGESATTSGLFTGYAMPLAAIGPIFAAIGSILFFSLLSFGVHIGTSFVLIGALLSFVLSLVMVFVLGLIINALAKTFDGTPDSTQALKVAIYSMTASWVGGVFGIIPVLGGLLALAATIYSIYLIFTGLPVLMKAPEDKAVGYTAVVVVIAIVLWIVVSMITSAVLALGVIGGAAAIGMH